MFRYAFKPGSLVPEDGIYWVHHYQHRISHQSFFKTGEAFPPCRKCGGRVRFEVSPEHPSAEHISRDPDFSGEPPEPSQSNDPT